MALTAIVSDIHGNNHALEAVIQDARDEGATRFWCLGDVVGYGAAPLACLDIIREVASEVLKGNHEQAVIEGPFGFNPLASAAIHWTRKLLENGGDRAGDGLEYITSLPRRVDDQQAVLVHGSPTESLELDEYLFREDTLNHLPRNRDYSPKLTRCFQDIDRPCFVGHTHVPGIIDAEFRWSSPADVKGSFDTGELPCIVNIGSVGQPRDGDRRASYALFDGNIVRFRRVAYDVEAAAQAIFDERELPDMLGQRLLEGW